MPKPSDEELLASAIPIDTGDADQIDIRGSEMEPRPASSGGSSIVELEATATASPDDTMSTKIRTFDSKRQPHEDHWQRQPNTTGTGAIHVKTFVAKLRLDAIEHLDKQVNQWLDNHPEYEVKFVTTNVGPLVGKRTEDALFVSVWV